MHFLNSVLLTVCVGLAASASRVAAAIGVELGGLDGAQAIWSPGTKPAPATGHSPTTILNDGRCSDA